MRADVVDRVDGACDVEEGHGPTAHLDQLLLPGASSEDVATLNASDIVGPISLTSRGWGLVRADNPWGQSAVIKSSPARGWLLTPPEPWRLVSPRS